MVLVQILLYVRGNSDPEGKNYLREENHSDNRRDHQVAKGMSLPQKYPGNNSKYYLIEVAENMANGLGKKSGKCRDICTEENNIKICEAVCYSDRPGNYFVQVYVAVVMPMIAPSGVYAFNLCQDGKCVNSGTVSTFGGMPTQTKIKSEEVVDNEKLLAFE